MKNPQELHRILGLIRDARAALVRLSDEEWYHHDSLPDDHPDKRPSERCAEGLEELADSLEIAAETLKACAY